MSGIHVHRCIITKESISWCVIIGALFLRFLLAPFAQHTYDMQVNKTWLRSAVIYGTAASFHQQVERIEMPNHGPLELGLYQLAGLGYRALVSPEMAVAEPWLTVFTKIPAMLFDIFAALAVLQLCRLVTTERKARLWALGALAHPILIYLSSLWGQTDVVYSALLFLSFSCLVQKRPACAGVAFAAGMLHKPNVLLFAPAILLLSIHDLRSCVRFCMAGAFVMIAVQYYFLLEGSQWSYFSLLAYSSERASGGLGNALNIWRVVFGTNMWSHSSSDQCLGILSCFTLGWGLITILSIPFLWIIWRLRSLDAERISIIFGATASLSLLFFLFGTGMHERYLFPYVLLGIPFAQRGWKQAMTYWMISFLFLVNLMDHWRPVTWFDALWSPFLGDAAAYLLLACGFVHMALVLHAAYPLLRVKKKGTLGSLIVRFTGIGRLWWIPFFDTRKRKR